MLGGAGFAAGFLGPIALNPEANQGPLLGIFITGPLGALLGAALGAALAAAGVERGKAATVAAAFAAAGGAVVLFFCLPGPKFRANLVAYEVARCQPPSALKDEAFARWDKSVAAVTWASPRPGWKEGFDAMAAADPGAVLTVKVTRAVAVYENRKPWNAGTYEARRPRRVAERYFLRGGSCAEQTPGKTGVFLAKGEASGGWPSANLPNFLNLTVMSPIPAEMSALIR